MYRAILIYLAILSTCAIPMYSQVKQDSVATIQVETMEGELTEAKNSIEALEREIEFMKDQNSQQLQFYKENQTTVFWMISVFLALIGGAFVLFSYLFKKPDDIWKKIKDTESEIGDVISSANDLLDRLTFQYKHQESIFILGKKGLYSFTDNDWNLVEVYAGNASSIPEQERTANDWFLMGLWSYHKKDYDLAISSYKQSLNLNKESEITWKHLGNAYDNSGDWKKALEAYQRVLELNPNNDVAYNNIGVVYASQGEFLKAERSFHSGLRTNPENPYIYTNYFESCLINDVEAEPTIVQQYLSKYEDDNSTMVSFDIISIFGQIVNGTIHDLNKVLDQWENKYQRVKSTEDFGDIENWIHQDKNQSVQKDLMTALNRFSSGSEFEVFQDVNLT